MVPSQPGTIYQSQYNNLYQAEYKNRDICNRVMNVTKMSTITTVI